MSPAEQCTGAEGVVEQWRRSDAWIPERASLSIFNWGKERRDARKSSLNRQSDRSTSLSPRWKRVDNWLRARTLRHAVPAGGTNPSEAEGESV
jgi:hypothetical protein